MKPIWSISFTEVKSCGGNTPPKIGQILKKNISAVYLWLSWLIINAFSSALFFKISLNGAWPRWEFLLFFENVSKRQLENTIKVLRKNEFRRGQRDYEKNPQFHLGKWLKLSVFSFKTVFNVTKRSKLKCFRKVTAQILNPVRRCLLWSDECRSSLNSQNERLYRDVEFKSELDLDDLVVKVDVQQPAVFVLAAASSCGEKQLSLYWRGPQSRCISRDFKEFPFPRNKGGYAMPLKRRQLDLAAWRGNPPYCQKDSGISCTGDPNFVRSNEWHPKSPDLNPCDYSVWSFLKATVAKRRDKILTLEDLKRLLV